ncbi:cell division protein FtsZ [Parelusimicrobium proximum]|uniref:cell division protein FtsZ n=1 Tax=Parelusimicrobium proximum TaxID=3228953 RepID=UPI003D17DC48
MSMDDIFSQADSFASKKARIRVVGVGGGGGNAINHMVSAGIEDVDFVAINTDSQDLRRNKAPYLVQVGERTTGGLGVGGDPKRGKESAEESLEKMKHILTGTDLLFITAGMGGGTGTGVAPVLAKLAKELYGNNILVVAVVTRPFSFEAYVREKQADEGIKELQQYVDTMIVVPNDRLFETIDVNTSSKEAFKKVDDVLLQAVKGIADVITKPGELNIDFNDVKKVMTSSGRALIGIGEGKGHGRHLAAVKQAITSPLLENADITGAKGLIVHFLAGDDLTLVEQREAMSYIQQYGSSDSIIMFGHTYDASLGDAMKVTVIATGFANDKKFYIPRKKPAVPATDGGKDTAGSGSVFQSDNNTGPEDNFLIPAYMRRKKEK